MKFSRQEYWSGVPFPTPGNLPDPGIEPASLALVGGFFTSSATWEAKRTYRKKQIRLRCKTLLNCKVKVKVKSLSHVRLFATSWTVAYQAPPSMGFSRQECWSGLPFPSPGDLSDPGIEPRSPALQAEWGGNPVCWWLGLYFCLVCCLNEGSCTGCYWWLGDAGSCIPVVSSVWVITIWYRVSSLIV